MAQALKKGVAKNMGKKILIGVASLGAVLFLGLAIAYVATQPQRPPAGSASAMWLVPGPYAVAEVDLTFTDPSRPTSANGDYPGSASRQFVTTMWYPDETDGDYPLIIYSHGFMSNRTEGDYIARNLASHGYVVVAPDYPLSNRSAPGGPMIADVIQQPADVSFLIDSTMSLEGDGKHFSGTIDPTRIGVVGLSLGGLTTELVTFHRRQRDPRIKAAVSIAGPAGMFTKRFFDSTATPFLMIAGTVDALVDYESNAALIPQLVANGSLLTIEGGSHTSFASVAEPLVRFMSNPDSLGCAAVLANIEGDSSENVFADLGDASDGIVFDADAPALCSVDPLPEAIHPGRQQMITQIAVLSFFQSIFAAEAETRDAAAEQLAVGLATDFAEVSYTN